MDDMQSYKLAMSRVLKDSAKLRLRGRRMRRTIAQRKRKEALMEVVVDPFNYERLYRSIPQDVLTIDNIILGRAGNVIPLLTKPPYNVSAILSCAPMREEVRRQLGDAVYTSLPGGHLVLPLEDDLLCRLPFRKAIAFLKEQTALGHNIFVHCFAGHNRAGAIVAAYLMQKWGKSASYVVGYLVKRRYGCLWNPSFRRQLIKWEAHLKTTALKNYAIEAVKIGTYYSEDKDEVAAYIITCFNELRRSKDAEQKPKYEENELTKKYSLSQLLDGAHGEECNIFDPFDEAEDSEEDSMGIVVEVQVCEGNAVASTAEPKPVMPVCQTELQQKYESLKRDCIDANDLPHLVEACVTSVDLLAAATLCEKVSWESASSEVLDKCFSSLKVLYNPAAQESAPRSLKKRLNRAINEIARVRHSQTSEGMEDLKANQAIERLNASLMGLPETVTTIVPPGEASQWIKAQLSISSQAAALCLKKLVESSRVKKQKRRIVFPSPLEPSSERTEEDAQLVEKLAARVREKKNARAKNGKRKKGKGRKKGKKGKVVIKNGKNGGV